MPLSDRWLSITATGRGTIKSTGAAFEYELGFLTSAHASQLMTLQGEILVVAPKPLPLYVRDHDFFARCAEAQGCIVGAWHDKRLIGYSVLYTPQAGEENYGEQLELAESELAHVGHLAGSGVHPDYRGNGLQKSLVALRNDFARVEGYVHLCGEVLPTNIISIRNHLARGFFLKGFKVDKFDLEVYLLHADLRADPRRVSDAVHEWDITDVAWYRRMLDDGLWGFKVTRRDSDWLLTCGQFTDELPDQS